MRLATAADLPLVFAWRNSDWIVSLGTLNRKVTLAEHTAWFTRVVASPDWLFYIPTLTTSAGDVPIGTVRFARTLAAAEVSIYLQRDYIGQGLGTRALRLGCEMAFAAWPIAQIDAEILPTNQASVASFSKVGFVPNPTKTDADILHYVLPRT